MFSVFSFQFSENREEGEKSEVERRDGTVLGGGDGDAEEAFGGAGDEVGVQHADARGGAVVAFDGRSGGDGAPAGLVEEGAGFVEGEGDRAGRRGGVVELDAGIVTDEFRFP